MSNIIEKIKHFHLKMYIYSTIKSFDSGISIYELALHCPNKSKSEDVAHCLEELIKENRIKYEGGLLKCILEV